MRAEEVKEGLLRVYEGREAFSVTFGRLGKTVWGRYLPCTRSIVVDRSKMANDTMVMYTALHELAHHICYQDKGQEGKRAHTKLFWGVYHDLLDRAEEAGIYERSRDGAVVSLVEQVKAKDRETAALQRELGSLVKELWGVCEEKGIRAEDVLERQAGLSRKTWKAMAGAAALRGLEGIEQLGQDGQARAVVLRNNHKGLRELVTGYLEGRSMAQLDRGKERRERDALEKLEAEEAELDRKIQQLQGRLFAVKGRILAIEKEREEKAG